MPTLKQKKKIESLRDLDAAELREQLAASKKDLFNLRVRAVTKDLQNTNELAAKRREVARINTILTQKESAPKA